MTNIKKKRKNWIAKFIAILMILSLLSGMVIFIAL
jgi:hypothetical protein